MKEDDMRQKLAELHAADPEMFATIAREVQRPPSKPSGRPGRPFNKSFEFWAQMKAIMAHYECGAPTAAGIYKETTGDTAEAFDGETTRRWNARSDDTITRAFVAANQRYKTDEAFRQKADFRLAVWTLAYAEGINPVEAWFRLDGMG